MRLEDLHTGARVRGLSGDGPALVESIQWIGSQGIKVIYRDPSGPLAERLLYRDDEPTLQVVEAGRPWSFDGDGELLRLVSEAYRIRLAWLFDPYVAISTSAVEPLPHQIAAVYQEMLPRLPLRFLLADDPGAGKTIMAGLLIKEMNVRGALERCLIISPGSLTEQWQDELQEKFGLGFDLLTRDMIRASRTANPFDERNRLIARMDQISRNEDLQERLLAAPEWDLVIVDEAHRMSAHYFGTELQRTKRYQLGQTVGRHARNLLLMTATPHNGKEEDFQLFLALLDGDRFEGRFRDSVHTIEPSDLMRRMVKEELVRFDGTPLFPERRSYTVEYELSSEEAHLYSEVTSYVREEMNRADRIADEEGQRKSNVGFALMTLQRRLASSPLAIFRSLERRRERLESRLREERLGLRGRSQGLGGNGDLAELTEDDWDELFDEAPQEEREEIEQRVTDNATTAQTIEELELEIVRLKELEELARGVVRSGTDAKWAQLNEILDDPLMTDERGHRRKLVVFSEFKDTLAYLAQCVRNRIGRDEAVVEIHGGVTREERRRIVHAFMNDPEVVVLIANDAAGEGVNLQRAHLMVNYDLPWNPNRLEQRFGRIHRIGQREVCHLWNLIAKDTREGDVYVRLLTKLEVEKEALGGKVYDVLGQLFEQRALRELLVQAIRYGNEPEVRARLDQVVDGAFDHEHLTELLEQRALVHDAMDTRKVRAIKEEMERAEARRLQPHFIQAFFTDAFVRLGGKLHPREHGRWEITHVPQAVRDRDRQVGTGAPVAARYERVCFEKRYMDEQPTAELVCPGHPLLVCTIDLVLERYGEVLRRGAVLVDESDPGERPRMLFYLKHAIQDGLRDRRGHPRVISQRLQFVEVDSDLGYTDAGSAPYLDYRPATAEEQGLLEAELDAEWMRRDWEGEVVDWASGHVVPGHLEEVRSRRLPELDKVKREVRSRLQKEIIHWDHRAQDLKQREQAGQSTRLPAHQAQERADRLADRLRQREAELERERAISPQAPRLEGGVLVVPGGLVRRLAGEDATGPEDAADAAARKKVELLAMEAVLTAELRLGRKPRDVSATTGLGYDIESRDPQTDRLYFIEVKGRVAGAGSVTLTANEIRRAMNVPEAWRLALVEVEGDRAGEPVYVQGFDFGQPVFAQTSASYSLSDLLSQGSSPS